MHVCNCTIYLICPYSGKPEWGVWDIVTLPMRHESPTEHDIWATKTRNSIPTYMGLCGFVYTELSSSLLSWFFIDKDENIHGEHAVIDLTIDGCGVSSTGVYTWTVSRLVYVVSFMLV